jgi:hypothetical protein
MIIPLICLVMALVDSSPSADHSGVQMHSNHVGHLTALNDIPDHLLEDYIFPYLSANEIDNFMSSLSSDYDHVKSIIKIWNPRKRLKLLKKELERIDPSFEDNYLLRYAAAKGMKDIVHLLLQYPSVDPTAKDNWALILARENNHKEVFNVLAQHLSEHDSETGRINRLKSSRALLSDVIHADFQVASNRAWAWKDLKLLLETSTQILPHLEEAILEAIRLGRTQLAKIMLFFVAFDLSYFNHMVLFRQLAAGNSLLDIRKLNPFAKEDESVFLNAISNGNVELANLILEKGLKLNPLRPFIFSRYFRERRQSLESAYYSSTDPLLKDRLGRIIIVQSLYNGALYLLAALLIMFSTFLFPF